MRKLSFPAVVAGLLLVGPAQNARAQFGGGVVICANCSSEPTSLAMEAKQLMQYIQEAQTALQAVQMAQMMTRAGINLVQHPSTNIAMDLGQLTTILAASQGLASNLARMDVTFQQQYGMYSPSPLLNFASQYNQWATTTMKTISGSLGAAGFQANSLNNDQLFLSQVQMQTQTPQGEMQALQLGNSIGAETVAQLMKLRQLMISDMSAKAAIAGNATIAQQQAQSVNQSAFTHAAWTADQRIW